MKTKIRRIPRVLLKAKKLAASRSSNAAGSYEKGPWDKGHWANRK